MPHKIGHACGKIILSGNTANRFGKRALAVPVGMYITAIWQENQNSLSPIKIIWHKQKPNGVWLNTVHKILKLIESKLGPLSGTLTIRNTLPLGKGMGSSTAIVVALSRCFLGENCKDDAMAIEDVINEGHSGLDFAAIWEERPIVIQGDKYEFTELPKGLQHGILVDTGLPIEPTSKIVRALKERLATNEVLMDSVETIGDCTDRLLGGEDPLSVFPDHYKGLINLGVIPPKVRSLIDKIQRAGGAGKPGRFGGTSGGAGMVFAVHPDSHALKKIVGRTPISIVYDPTTYRFISQRAGRSKQ
jgi:hypothetical protein